MRMCVHAYLIRTLSGIRSHLHTFPHDGIMSVTLQSRGILALIVSHRSTGRHITLKSRSAVEQAMNMTNASCPEEDRIASLEVQGLWVPRGRKFDHRIYVLLPSLKDPFMALLREGHLRVSTVDYQASVIASHVTNLAVQARSCLQSVPFCVFVC